MDDLEARQQKMRERVAQKRGGSRSPNDTLPAARQSEMNESETPDAERMRRITENYKDWLTLLGERREGPVRRVQADLSFSMKLEFASLPPMSLEDSAGDMIDILIGLCHSRPVYLRKSDADRYITLLHELKDFRTQYWNGAGLSDRAVGEGSIANLKHALEAWILSYMAEGCHPMLPAYALDTGRFLEFHLTGARRIYDSPSWELTPLLSEGGHRYWGGIFGRSFKREFTQLFKSSVQCIVPPGGTMKPDVIKGIKGTNGEYRTVDREDAEILIERLGPGSTFPFTISRCHLSESFYDSIHIETSEEPLQFDLMKEFEFHGKIIVPHRDDPSIIFEVPSIVPARWISHAIVRTGANEELLPVPRWSLDEVPSTTERVQ